MDLQNDPEFQSLGVALVSLGNDPLSTMVSVAEAHALTTPLLSDEGGRVAQAYTVLRWATATGEPGHTFVLVGGDGTVRWLQDYGAPENRGVMYVDPAEITAEVREALGSR